MGQGGGFDEARRRTYIVVMGLVEGRVMATVRRSMVAVLVAAGIASFASSSARADGPVGNGTVLAPADPGAPPAAPGSTPGLVGLQAGALALAPPGSAAAARDDGLAGSPQTGIDLSYVPPAERDSYLNSRDFAEHLQTSTRKGHHPSALSQVGGAAEGMAINGAIMGLSGLTIGAH